METTEPITAGKSIKITRIKKGWTVTKLAKLSGVDRAHLSKIEAEIVSPRSDTISKLEQALGVVPLENSFPAISKYNQDKIYGGLIRMLNTNTLLAEFLLVSLSNEHSVISKSYKEFVTKITES
jgi:transcriptional regulator with XRE-family HTH domain